MTINDEIQYLGNMLYATRKEDKGRIAAIIGRLAQLLSLDDNNA